MILGFSTQINGKPTYFVEKIHSCFIQFFTEMEFDLDGSDYNFNIEALAESEPKLHTIREDKNDRWKPGVIIDFFINVRTKKMFRFAPSIPVISTQKIDISWHDNPYNDILNPVVWIDDNLFYDKEFSFGIEKMLTLAKSDGFNSIEDFFLYFNKDFYGKLIHWTEIIY